MQNPRDDRAGLAGGIREIGPRILPVGVAIVAAKGLADFAEPGGGIWRRAEDCGARIDPSFVWSVAVGADGKSVVHGQTEQMGAAKRGGGSVPLLRAAEEKAEAIRRIGALLSAVRSSSIAIHHCLAAAGASAGALLLWSVETRSRAIAVRAMLEKGSAGL